MRAGDKDAAEAHGERRGEEAGTRARRESACECHKGPRPPPPRPKRQKTAEKKRREAAGSDGRGEQPRHNECEHLKRQLAARDAQLDAVKEMAAEAEVQAAEREAEVAAAHRGRAEATLLIGVPDPLPSRERSQAVAPTELAKKLLVEYGKRMREAWVQLGEYMNKGVFRLPRRAVAEGRKRRARKPRAAPAPRAPTARQRAAVLGKNFEDEGVQWRVLDVKWSAEYSEIVVFYYDVEDADEEELKAIDATDDFEGCGLDAVEMSTLSEVMKWIKESALVAKGGGGEVGSKRRASRDGERAD